MEGVSQGDEVNAEADGGSQGGGTAATTAAAAGWTPALRGQDRGSNIFDNGKYNPAFALSLFLNGPGLVVLWMLTVVEVTDDCVLWWCMKVDSCGVTAREVQSLAGFRFTKAGVDTP